MTSLWYHQGHIFRLDKPNPELQKTLYDHDKQTDFDIFKLLDCSFLRGYTEKLPLTFLQHKSLLLFVCLATVSLPLPCGTGLGCHGTKEGIHAVYDNECNVGGPVLDYRNTEVRSPWREDGFKSKPP